MQLNGKHNKAKANQCLNFVNSWLKSFTMKKIKPILAVILAFFYTTLIAQDIFTLTSGTKTSIRGLSVVNDKIVWASGSNGWVARSVDGGKNFTWMQVPQFEKKEFRDIEAFDSNTAIIMSIAEPAYILKTTNGGNSWQIVFADSAKGMFLDAMDFTDNKNGVVIGDPIGQKAFVAYTRNGGNSWAKPKGGDMPALDSGEAFFASSGSNIVMRKKKNSFEYVFVSGGKKSHLFINNKKFNIPLVQDAESTGANAIAVHQGKAIIVGGDFNKDSATTGNCAVVDLNKMKVTLPLTNPSGYRSGVCFINHATAICCGLNGVDISFDGGNNWKQISKEGFHVVKKAKQGNSVFLAGSKGRIALLKL